MTLPRLASLPVLILAGGLGTRLRPVLPDCPKGLADIGGETFLEIQIQFLRRQGARRFVLCIGHRADQIRDALGDGRHWGVRIDYSVEEKGLLGTAGALKQAERFFVPRALVVNGDTFFPLDYEAYLRRHWGELQGESPLATLAVTQAVDDSGFGRVCLDISQRTVVEFQEKHLDAAQRSGWFSGGVYVVERELLKLVPGQRPCSLEREIFPQVLQTGRRLGAFATRCPFFDIGTPERLERFRSYYSGREGLATERT